MQGDAEICIEMKRFVQILCESRSAMPPRRTHLTANCQGPHLTGMEYSLHCFGLREALLISMRFEFYE
jgi:hypothetical protein